MDAKTSFTAEDLESILHDIINDSRKVDGLQRRRLGHILENLREDLHEKVRPFRFLDLPSEIRNQIYDRSVIIAETIWLPLPGAKRAYGRYPNHKFAGQPPFTKVCRQIRDEALPIFYAWNYFVAHIERYNFKPLIKLLNFDMWHMPTAMRNLKWFHVDLALSHGLEDGEHLTCAAGLWDLVCWFVRADYAPEAIYGRLYPVSGLVCHWNDAEIEDAVMFVLHDKDLWIDNDSSPAYSRLRDCFERWLKERGRECKCRELAAAGQAVCCSRESAYLEKSNSA